MMLRRQRQCIVQTQMKQPSRCFYAVRNLPAASFRILNLIKIATDDHTHRMYSSAYIEPRLQFRYPETPIPLTRRLFSWQFRAKGLIDSGKKPIHVQKGSVGIVCTVWKYLANCLRNTSVPRWQAEKCLFGC